MKAASSGGKMSEKLTPKQALFVQEYLIDLNATQAAIRSGYSEKTAHRIGQENIHKPIIKAAIADAQDARAARTMITQDRILHESARIAFADPAAYVDENGKIKKLSALTPDQRAAIKSIKHLADGSIELQFWDKLGAIEKLMKNQGLYEKDNAQLSGGPPEIQVSFVDPVPKVENGSAG